MVVLAIAACQGKAPASAAASQRTGAGPAFDHTQAAADAKQAATPDAKPDDAKAEVAKADEAKAEPPPGAHPDAGGGDALGRRFLDPPWFRKTIFEDAKAVDVKRTEADDQGRFSSQLLIDLADGTTSEQCAAHLEERVRPHVANLARAEAKGDGRIRLDGSTDRYTVTFVCGDAKGVMKAYVAYAWTS